ncbi:hypothetical protein BpHYR1_028124 [Brachionus plicatilis]|uniref:Uncharacterized protein n=1 Tax=Brachionus plicatilis TaxID=10195 RepID=A0A3M7SLK7_BRAPC|nr:hypothetical protein BpHYR1_028124 [Brachionus plicatilis]
MTSLLKQNVLAFDDRRGEVNEDQWCLDKENIIKNSFRNILLCISLTPLSIFAQDPGGCNAK